MVHADPHETEIAAAEKILPKLRELHIKVLGALKVGGPMTDEELERLPDFVGYGPTTIRKRRGELFDDGYVEAVGKRTNSRGAMMKVWRVKPGATYP